MSSESAPALRGHWLWGNLMDFNKDNLRFIEQAAGAGDLVRIRFGPMRGVFVNHPDYVCKVLAARSKSFRKPAVVQRALSDILGENIFTSNGAAWKRSRQALQPAFHRRHVERYTQIMLDCAERELRGWEAGSVIDLEAAMIRVTMKIIARTMFDADLGDYAEDLTAIFTRLFHLAYKRMKRYALAPNWLPTKDNREVKRLTAEIRNRLKRYIADWRAGRAGEASLLNLTLAPSPKMSDDQLINEAITIIGAGYETTAYTLVFVWLAMMRNPRVMDRVYAEVDEVIGTRALALADLPALKYSERVVKEALRLYPSAWGLSRSTLEAVEIGGTVLPRNSMVLVSPWTLGRDPRWFPDPLRFEPDRHLQENAASIPHYAYIPFGGGGRTCLGIRFALMEAVIIIASIARRYRLDPEPGSASGPKSVAFTLRPNGPMRVRLKPRSARAAVSRTRDLTGARRSSGSSRCPFSSRMRAKSAIGGSLAKEAIMSKQRKRIKVTYSTLGSPDPLLHEYFEEDVAELKRNLGGRYKMLIDGAWVDGDGEFENRSPINTDWLLGVFARAGGDHVRPSKRWPPPKPPSPPGATGPGRNAAIWSTARPISSASASSRSPPSSAWRLARIAWKPLAMSKKRPTSSAIGVDAMRDNGGFDRQLRSETDQHFNRSVLKPYGVWGVIGPFNFPAALTGGPTGAALVAGNTVVLKPAAEGSLTAVMIAQCFVDAGIPAGVFNMVLGGDDPGIALTSNPDLAGLTFTGSYAVGMSIIRDFSTAAGYFRPVIAEMGGKNPAIVSASADLDKAALGVMRSAFGLTGQKCSACSRVYVDAAVKDAFVEKLVALTADITIGDPTDAAAYMGPMINEGAYEAYQAYIGEIEAEHIRTGGDTLDMGNGYFVAPTVVTDLPDDHRLWQHEMFAPIVAVRAVEGRDEAIRLANGVALGLTAGLYSEDQEEVDWFLDNIEAGVLYVNRATGATTGAWPGYQSFGGWKGSTGSNKASGSWYYLQQYMREQSHTIVG